MAVTKGLQERGVHLRVLTNSLAATDAPIVHVGYAKYRSALLDGGVELYELRPTLGDRPKMFGTFRSAQASLHVKSVIVDRSTLFVGSMNVDPRSVGLNTETGLIIHSPVLSQAVARLFDAAIRSSAYHVTQHLNPHAPAQAHVWLVVGDDLLVVLVGGPAQVAIRLGHVVSAASDRRVEQPRHRL